MPAAPRSLYLHVPFCPQVCPYCDFHKMRRAESLVPRYLERTLADARAEARRWPGPLDTLYVGGGTPTTLTRDELERLLAGVADAFGGLGSRETTVEADPGTFDAARLRALAEVGVTRVSIGMQSFDDATLRFLGRSHDAASGRRAIDIALASGLQVNVDLITAVPGQDARRDLQAVAALGVHHVSVYSLTIEPFTPFARRGVRVDEDRAADDYELAQEVLAGAGLHRYEVSNHARPGCESAHNRAYWRGDGWLALGPSAAGFEPPGPDDPPWARGVRTLRPPLKAYLAGAEAERTPVDGPTLALELLMTGLRTREGVALHRVEARTGVTIDAAHPRPLAAALRHGLLERDGDRLRATARGTMVLDAVLRTFFADAPPVGTVA